MPKKKNLMPKMSMPHQKFHHNQNFSHVHTQLPIFFHNHAQSKFLHDQDSQQKFPTCPCTTSKFSHIQNHSQQTSHTQQNFSIAKISCPLKLIHIHKICLYPQIYPCSHPQKFCHVHEINLHIPTKFPTCIMNMSIQAYNTNFPPCQCPQNPS